MTASTSDTTAHANEWLVVKRGLYWRPKDCGYTGIRDHAARYTEEEARKRCRSEEVTMIRLADAPEFTDACFDDLALAHLTKQRDEVRAENELLREALAVLRGWNIGIQEGRGNHYPLDHIQIIDRATGATR